MDTRVWKGARQLLDTGAYIDDLCPRDMECESSESVTDRALIFLSFSPYNLMISILVLVLSDDDDNDDDDDDLPLESMLAIDLADHPAAPTAEYVLMSPDLNRGEGIAYFGPSRKKTTVFTKAAKVSTKAAKVA